MTRLLLLPLIFSAGYLPAQIQESLRVIQRDVRVHVLDRDGNPVRGLEAADFILFEDDEERFLNFFEEVDLSGDQPERIADDTGGEEATRPIDPQRSRTCVIVLDSSNLSPGGFEVCKRSVADLIGRLGDNDLVKLIQIDRDMIDLTPFTRNPDELIAGLETARYQGAQYRDIARQEREIIAAIQAYLETPTQALIGNELLTNEARRVNREVEIKEGIKNAYYRTFYYNMIYLGNMLANMSGSKSVFLVSGGSYIETDGRLASTLPLGNRLERVLNKADATVYSFMFKERQTRAESALQTWGNPTRLPLQRLRTTWNFAEVVGQATAGTANDGLGAQNTVFENQFHSESGLDEITEGTGGILTVATAPQLAEKRLTEVFDTAAHYYRLGYSLGEPEEETRVRIKLTRDIPGARLVYGRGFLPEEDYRDLDERERDVVLRTLLYFNDVAQNDLDAAWRAHLYFGEREDEFLLSLFGHVPQPRKPAAGYEIAFAAFDVNGTPLDQIVSDVTRFPDGDRFDFYDVLITRRAPAYVKCYARNMDTGELALMRLDIPKALTAIRATRISEIQLGSPESPHPVPLNHTRQVELEKGEYLDPELIDRRVTLDPLIVDKKLFKPSFHTVFDSPDAITAHFLVEQLPEGPHQLIANFYVYSERSGARPITARIVNREERGSTISYVAEINTAELEPDDYQLLVRVTKQGLAGELRGARPFTIR